MRKADAAVEYTNGSVTVLMLINGRNFHSSQRLFIRRSYELESTMAPWCDPSFMVLSRWNPTLFRKWLMAVLSHVYHIYVKIGFCGCAINDNIVMFIGAFSDFRIQVQNSDLNLKFKFKSGFWT